MMTEDGFVPHVSDDVDAMIGLPGFFAVGVQVGLAGPRGRRNPAGRVHRVQHRQREEAGEGRQAQARTRVSSPQRHLSAICPQLRGQNADKCPKFRGRIAELQNITVQNKTAAAALFGIPGSKCEGKCLLLLLLRLRLKRWKGKGSTSRNSS